MSGKPTTKKVQKHIQIYPWQGHLCSVMLHQDPEEMKGYDQGKCFLLLFKLLIIS